MTTSASTAFLLNLRPLDRVQVCDPSSVREAFLGCTMRRAELPWWFYQGLRADGALVLRSPGGFTSYIDPADVVDVRRGELIRLRAMSHLTYKQHLATRRGPQDRPPDALYLQASLLYVQKDRWGGVGCYVDFDAKEHNKDRFLAPVHSDDRLRIESMASRRVMPVVAPGAANWSADFDENTKAAATRRSVLRSLASVGWTLRQV